MEATVTEIVDSTLEHLLEGLSETQTDQMKSALRAILKNSSADRETMISDGTVSR